MEWKGNILVVDDEIGPRESMRMIMQDDHHIVTAECGREALERMGREAFDLVTLDLNMPDMNGIDVLKQIRERDDDVQVVIVTGYGTLATAQQAMRFGAMDYITKPFSITEIQAVAAKAIGRKRLQEKMRGVMRELGDRCREGEEGQGDCVTEELSGPVQQAFAAYGHLGVLDFIEVLSRTLEEKNATMHQHSLRVNHQCRRVARALGLSAKEQEHLTIAALLHDIGKVGISNDILNKAGTLTPAEWKEIREHPRRGVRIIRPLSLPEEILSIILHHHESFEGRGYPQGLAGEEIPLGARIIRVVDSYDAMISNRPYRRARSLEWVIEELRSCAGTQFDPRIVGVFVECLVSGEASDRAEQVAPLT